MSQFAAPDNLQILPDFDWQAKCKSQSVFPFRWRTENSKKLSFRVGGLYRSLSTPPTQYLTLLTSHQSLLSNVRLFSPSPKTASSAGYLSPVSVVLSGRKPLTFPGGTIILRWNLLTDIGWLETWSALVEKKITQIQIILTALTMQPSQNVCV